MNTVQSSGGGHGVTKGKDQNFEELVVSTPNQRNWRGILIALLVIVAVLGLIICSILLLSPPDEGPRIKGIQFSLNDVIGSDFTPKLFNGTWISETELVYMDYYGGIKVLCVENSSTRSLMTNVTFRQLNAVDYKVSADLNFVLLMTEVSKLWAHSFRARYYVYDVGNQMHFPLTLNGEEDSDTDKAPFLESATWAPTGNGIAFVYKNNVYYKKGVNKSQLYTFSRHGKEGVIFNGRPDFLYETKILETGTAFWFSPDSNMFAFASFNCSAVGQMHYPYYKDLVYEEIHTYRFPKAGTSNPIVKLTIVDLNYTKIYKSKEVKRPEAYMESQDFYMTGMQWINNRDIAVTWMNRWQNITSISVCRSPHYECKEMHREKSNDSWVNKIPKPIFDQNSNRCLAILPIPDAGQDYFQQVCLMEGSSLPLHLTSAPMTVLEILAWDLTNHLVYFIATMGPGTRHLFRTGDRSSNQQPDCLTCYPDNATLANGRNGQNKTNGSSERNYGFYRNFIANYSFDENDRSPHCLFSKVYFNSVYNPRYYILDCLGPEVPSTVLVEVATNTIVNVLNLNSRVRHLFKTMAIPQIKTFQVEMESGYHAQVRLYLPPGLREYEEMTFPLILHVDSTPGSQLVNEKFQVDWLWYLSGNRSFIIAEIDGRGTGYQGERLVREIRNKIGSVEVEDQIAVTLYLRDTLKFVDKHRIGVFGRGHGGYVAAMILSQDKDSIFRCGAFVNPVTNFKLTDSFSTEKYLGMPNATERCRAYDEADLNKKVENLKNKQFLLVTSTADTEVSIQHSMQFIHALVKDSISFKHQIYPDEGHELSEKSSLHYYSLMDAFWDECFAPLDLHDWETMSSFTPFTKE